MQRERHITVLRQRELGLSELEPQSRGLACGQEGRSEGLGTRLSAAPGLP